ncbi:extracellular solute-binding protein [Anaerocolumna chitinilytica]|uniref:ABC transporter substrate-binding protein n=1 Tax=Anaerocolumna chitinilytica TaxID=1727145 RepID=A0A7I8DN54_9FIRM|nr:extracellular solute-binding protein [Anaerocolumna chitinilytica]BCJ99853.1 ABC transporter substrate-binding protein [Anaerocolumna chitinilytica]
MKSKKSLIILLITVLFVIIAVTALILNKDHSKGMYAVPASNAAVYDTSYKEYLDQNGYNGTILDTSLQVNLNSFKTTGGMTAEKTDKGLATGDSGSITWTFEVQTEGFYNLQIGYIPRTGTTSDIQRRLLLNGEICYDGLEQVVFKRFWTDGEIKSKNGNEIRPNTKEIYKETKIYVEDSERRTGEPYVFYLKKGTNTLTFEAIKEPVEFTSIIFQKAEKPAAYAEVINQLKEKYPVYDGKNIICQAERAEGGTSYIEKNSSSINIQKNYSDSLLYPYHPYKIKYNTIGANNWKQPGNAISWDITVPKEGLYELTFKGRQNLKRGVTSVRRLYINGTVPYSEMDAVNFDYSSSMSNYTITGSDGTPYLFYLKAGTNTISLECVMGDFGGIINDVEESMYRLNQMYLKVTQITGQTPDKFIDYQIAKKIPDFQQTMTEEEARLYQIVDNLVAITGEKGENTSLLEKMAVEAKGLAKNPESVVEEVAQLKENISALATWLVNISEMPLELDSFILSSPGGDLPRAKSSFMESAYYGTIRFFSTFFAKISQVSEKEDTAGGDTIKVWMVNAGTAANVQSIGREQAQIIQNLIDEKFTPENNINIDLQLIPVDVVLRAALAGNSPDAVIGLNQATLLDFAMRGAVVDLSKLDGFSEATGKYYKSELDAASYLGSVYGIPEQADFMMLFTRDDILKAIGAETPKTWEDVKAILPVLKKNNYEFFLPNAQGAPNFYPSLVYQFGGNLYKGTGNDYGIAGNLGTDAAMEAFKTYTDFFTNYGFNPNVDFSTRFRTGEMPIGVIKYTTYCQLEVFAPEIKGLWSFTTLPGVKGEDGAVNDSYVIETVNSAILNTSKKKEAAWKFVKWWNNTETQLQYANTVESVMGTSARYPAADPEVIKRLPWSNAELTQILSQMQSTVGIPAVPGNYMLTRMVLYSFNNVVAEGANPRETLYLNLKTIDKEITNKRREFHLSVQK